MAVRAMGSRWPIVKQLSGFEAGPLIDQITAPGYAPHDARLLDRQVKRKWAVADRVLSL